MLGMFPEHDLISTVWQAHVFLSGNNLKGKHLPWFPVSAWCWAHVATGSKYHNNRVIPIYRCGMLLGAGTRPISPSQPVCPQSPCQLLVLYSLGDLEEISVK